MRRIGRWLVLGATLAAVGACGAAVTEEWRKPTIAASSDTGGEAEPAQVGGDGGAPFGPSPILLDAGTGIAPPVGLDAGLGGFWASDAGAF